MSYLFDVSKQHYKGGTKIVRHYKYWVNVAQ